MHAGFGEAARSALPTEDELSRRETRYAASRQRMIVPSHGGVAFNFC
jgi:hypothetical protein